MVTPSPLDHFDDDKSILLAYLDNFREQAIDVVSAMTPDEQRHSRLASGWTPRELLHHLAFVELRWLVWGFKGREVTDPWGDWRDGRWFVAPEITTADVIEALRAQGRQTRQIVESAELGDIGQPSERWDDQSAPNLRRILFHLIQEYARHVGHLDIVAEIAN